MTLEEMQRIRDETYKVPDTKRCETCKYCFEAIHYYCKLSFRRFGDGAIRPVAPAGLCDLWKEST